MSEETDVIIRATFFRKVLSILPEKMAQKCVHKVCLIFVKLWNDSMLKKLRERAVGELSQIRKRIATTILDYQNSMKGRKVSGRPRYSTST